MNHYISMVSTCINYCHILKKIGKSSGVAPVASVAFTALGCGRPAVGTPAAAKHCSLGGGQNSHVWLFFLYMVRVFSVFCSTSALVYAIYIYLCYLCSWFVCILCLFSDDFCISFCTCYELSFASKRGQAFFVLSSKCNRFVTVRLRQGLRERRLHGSIQGWHLWATSSASRQRLSNPEIFRCQQLFG